jgi:hypothetical protein
MIKVTFLFHYSIYNDKNFVRKSHREETAINLFWHSLPDSNDKSVELSFLHFQFIRFSIPAGGGIGHPLFYLRMFTNNILIIPACLAAN